MADERRIVMTRLSDVKLRTADPGDVAALRRQIDLAENETVAADSSVWEAGYHYGYADAMRWVVKHRLGVRP